MKKGYLSMESSDPSFDFCFDDIFNEKTEYTKYTFGIYHSIYNLPTIEYQGEVTDELFKYCLHRDFFILLVLYDEDGRIFLKRNFEEKLNWSLLGGSIKRNEDIHSAIRRISQDLSTNRNGVTIGEIEPVAFVRNEFIYKKESCTHHGIAFVARIRNKKDFSSDVVLGNFIYPTKKEFENINRFANREVARLAYEKIKLYKTPFLEKEIYTNEQCKWRYKLHENIMKRFILTERLKKKKLFLKKIENTLGEAKSFLDISCGDSDMIFRMSEMHDFNYLVGNDISWSQIKLLENSSKNIIFTNHNSVYLPFKDNSFDVSYCGNTLHHINSREEMEKLFQSMKKVSKKIVIVEIEKPGDTGFIPYILNKFWYIGFLKDTGGSYLGKKEFYSIVKREFPQDEYLLEFSEFRNIQGRYLIAEIQKKELLQSYANSDYMEVEDKFYCVDEDGLIGALENDGYKETSELYEEDDYFSDLDGNCIKDRVCIRLRKSSRKTEFTFKGKSDAFSSRYSKIEKNFPITVERLESFKETLVDMGYYPIVNLGKKRKLFSKKINDNIYNVSFDEINDEDIFVEFEILILKFNVSSSTKTEQELENFIKPYKKYLDKEANLPYRDFCSNKIVNNIIKKDQTEALIFDLDGTIIPSEHLFFDVYSQVAKEFFNYTIRKEDYKTEELIKGEKLIDLLESKDKISGYSRDKFFEELYKRYSERFISFCDNNKIRNNFKLLTELAKDYKLGLSTASKRIFVESLLDKMNARNLFSAVVCKEDISNTKPDPEIYQKIAELLNTDKNKCLVFEDSPRGILSAKKADLRTIAVMEYSFFSQEEILKISDVPCLLSISQIFLLLKYYPISLE